MTKKFCKPELITSVAEIGEMTKKDAEKAIDAVLKSFRIALSEGKKIMLVGDFSLDVQNRKSRVGRNPGTGEEIQIDACNFVKFKAGKLMEDAIIDVVVPEKVKGEFKGKKKEVVVED